MTVLKDKSEIWRKVIGSINEISKRVNKLLTSGGKNTIKHRNNSTKVVKWWKVGITMKFVRNKDKFKKKRKLSNVMRVKLLIKE